MQADQHYAGKKHAQAVLKAQRAQAASGTASAATGANTSAGAYEI